MALEEKLDRLNRLLDEHQRVAIAFSGGVDSSLLLLLAIKRLGSERVTALHADSELRTLEERRSVRDWAERHGCAVHMVRLPFVPLAWKEFTANTPERCYFCKKRMYTLFIEEMERQGIDVLMDGTNVDDLKDHRPGLRALHELGVRTPFIEAGFNKEEIRGLSLDLGLDTWEMPSSSCLATRIPTGMPITAERIGLVAEWEKFLHGLGFHGCRARLDPHDPQAVTIALRGEDMERFVQEKNRLYVQRYFRLAGMSLVRLDLRAR